MGIGNNDFLALDFCFGFRVGIYLGTKYSVMEQ